LRRLSAAILPPIFEHLGSEFETTPIGFRCAPTVITNDPSVIENAFSPSDQVVAKSLSLSNWTQNGKVRVFPTTSFNIEKTGTEPIKFYPTILQERINGEFEVRAVFFSDQYIAAKIENKKHPESPPLDWRTWSKSSVKISPIGLPDQIVKKCAQLMKMLGIRFGAFDLIVDRRGDYWFLEVNDSGNFLFLEERCEELFLLDAVVQFLSKKTEIDTFKIKPSTDPIRLKSFLKPSQEYIERDKKLHEEYSEVDK